MGFFSAVSTRRVWGMMREENLAKALEQNVSVYFLDVEKSALEARNACV